jgi:hypothetical protein
MTPEIYARLSEKALAWLYVRSHLDIRKDEMRTEDEEGNKGGGLCKRLHDLPLHVSQAFACRLKEIAGTQKEVERRFYGFDDTGETAAEGRKQREYELALGAMPMWRARGAAHALAWEGFHANNDEWYSEANSWITRFDGIAAARPIYHQMRRRKLMGRPNVSKTLKTFHKALVDLSLARLERNLKELGLDLAAVDVGTHLSH